MKKLLGFLSNFLVGKEEKVNSKKKRKTKAYKDNNISLVKEKIFEDIERKKAQEDHPAIAANLTSGELSQNTNWVGIETIGDYLNPIGNDNKHIVVLTKIGKRDFIHVATIECTNSLYSEWINCLCETMWHTRHKVLEDVHGNKYPVGQMIGLKCSIKYAR